MQHFRCEEKQRDVLLPVVSRAHVGRQSNNVIDIRLRSIATGKVNAKEETRLMVSEKIDAALEAGSMLVNGRRPAEVIDLYRKHVAANAARLS